MPKDNLICITTFQKSDSLELLVKSLIKHEYLENSDILICDDYAGQPYEVAKKKNPQHPIWQTEAFLAPHDHMDDDVAIMESAVEIGKRYGIKVAHGKTPQQGVSRNKNRGIDYFLKNPQYKTILFLDDDQEFHRSGLIQELRKVCENNQINHITGEWNSNEPVKLQLMGGTWQDNFPVEAIGDGVTYHLNGSHGNAHFYTRKCLDMIGFFDTLKFGYGYEHSLHTCRAMQVVDKRSPKLHPQHSRAWKYYRQCSLIVPNNYEVKDPHANSQQYLEVLNKIWNGLSLKLTDSGLNPKEEVVV